MARLLFPFIRSGALVSLVNKSNVFDAALAFKAATDDSVHTTAIVVMTLFYKFILPIRFYR